MEWSRFDYYCPSDDDRAVLQELGLERDNPPWVAVEAELVAAGIPHGDVRQLSGPAAIRMLIHIRTGSSGGDPQSLGPSEDKGKAASGEAAMRSLSPNEQAVWDSLQGKVLSASEIAEHCGLPSAEQARNCVAGIRDKRGQGVIKNRPGGGYYRVDAAPSPEELSRPRPRRPRVNPR